MQLAGGLPPQNLVSDVLESGIEGVPADWRKHWLVEPLQKSGDGDFLRAVAEAVLQILMEADGGRREESRKPASSGVVWLKHLENRSREQPEAADPMATYDFTWLWRELKVEDLRP